MVYLDNLPTEVLFEIFKFLPSFDNIKLVNKQFYSIAVKLSDPNNFIVIMPELMKKQRLLENILNSQRIVSEIRIDWLDWWTQQLKLNSINKIIQKFGSNIKQLSITAELINLSDVVDILNMVPMVEKLKLGGSNFSRTHVQPPLKRLRLDELNLKHLKVLTILPYSADILLLCNRLPNGVLRELNVCTNDCRELEQLVKRQLNIRKLTVHVHSFAWSETVTDVNVDFLNQLQLESLSWTHRYVNVDIKKIVAAQPKLKELHLRDDTDGSVVTMFKDSFSDLVSLTLNISSLTPASLRNLEKLKKLKNLTIAMNLSSDIARFDAITKLDNTRIESMDISNCYGITPDKIEALSLSAPNLKQLRCTYDYDDYDPYTLDAILKNFNFLECLRLDGLESFDVPDGNYYVNVNLKSIEIEIDDPECLQYLATACPNLKTLRIKRLYLLTTTQFERILSGFPKLEHLSIIEGASRLIRSDFNCLRRNKNNLKFIYLGDINPKLIKGKKASNTPLHGIFDVVKARRGVIAAADDIKTFVDQIDRISEFEELYSPFILYSPFNSY